MGLNTCKQHAKHLMSLLQMHWIRLAGPGETIFTPDFYECMYKALNSNGGVACVQSECMWINLNLISDVVHCCNDFLDYAEYATANIPSFPCGQTGFILGRKGYSYSCQHPVRLPSRKLSSQLKWYNPVIHTAAFQLPEFVKATLGIEENKEMAVLLEVVPYCDMSHSQQQIRMRLKSVFHLFRRVLCFSWEKLSKDRDSHQVVAIRFVHCHLLHEAHQATII